MWNMTFLSFFIGFSVKVTLFDTFMSKEGALNGLISIDGRKTVISVVLVFLFFSHNSHRKYNQIDFA